MLRVTAASSNDVPTHEAFTIAFEEVDAGAHLVMTWENTSVRVPIMAH